MTSVTIITFLMTMSLGIIFLMLYLWAVKSGQFSDPEEAKYIMFREEETSSLFEDKKNK